MKNYLIKFVADWADEMDVHGICIMSEDELNKFKTYWRKWFKENDSFSCYVGSNEELEFYSLEDFEDTLEIHEVNDTEMAVLKKFGLDDFGCTNIFNEHKRNKDYDY